MKSLLRALLVKSVQLLIAFFNKYVVLILALLEEEQLERQTFGCINP